MYDLTNLWNKVKEDQEEYYPESKIGTVVYTLTPNYSWYVLPSLVSLLRHNEVEKVYFITETTEWDYTLPENVYLVDVSNQQWFNEDCRSGNSDFSNIVLLRVVLSEILSEDKILLLDCDTIINKPVDALWRVDLADSYFAMANEVNTVKGDAAHPGHFITRTGQNFNMGVTLMNLEKLREDKAHLKLVYILNELDLRCPEQDAINLLYQDKIITIRDLFNYCTQTKSLLEDELYLDPVIIHYAGEHKCYLDSFDGFASVYIQYYKLYIEKYSGLIFKDSLPTGV